MSSSKKCSNTNKCSVDKACENAKIILDSSKAHFTVEQIYCVGKDKDTGL